MTASVAVRPPLPDPSSPEPTSTSAPPTVQAVIVAPALSEIGPLLDLVSSGQRIPESVVVLAPGSPDEFAEVVASCGDTPFSLTHVPTESGMPPRVALSRWALADAPAASDPSAASDGADSGARDEGLLWLLTPHALPEVGALEHLVAAHRRSASVGIAGPKHVEASAPQTLRSVGIFATRTGRLIPNPDLGEPDQGQCDHRADVLAVPLAGMLVRREVIRQLRGWEPSFGDLGADLDLGWRSQQSGHRVVVVPRARMRSWGDDGLASASEGPRRRAARRVALARTSWWSAPIMALWIALTSVVSCLGLMLLKRPRASGVALADLGALDPVRGVLARWRTRGRRVVTGRGLSSVFVPATVVARRSLDRAHEAVLSPAALGDEGGTEAASRGGLTRLLSHPMLWATIVVVAAVAAASRTVGGGLLARVGSGVAGGELLPTSADAHSMWRSAFDSWNGSGLGGPDPAGLSRAVLAVPTWILEHLPGVGPLNSPAGAVIGALLVLAPLLGLWTAYFAARVLTPSRWLRALSALGWVGTSVAAASVAQGRIGAVVALIMLPAVLAGVVMLTRAEGTATGAFATGLAAALLAAFAPPLAVLVAVVCVAVVVTGHGWARARAIVPIAVTALLLSPWLAQTGATWQSLATGPGLSSWGSAAPEPVALGLWHPGGDGATPWWAAVGLIVVGVLGLLTGARLRSLTTGCAVLIVGSLAAVLASPHITLATVPAGSGLLGDAPPGPLGVITPWAGTFMLPLALGVIAAACAGVEALRTGSSSGRLRSARTHTAYAIFAASTLVGIAAVGWFGFGTTLQTWSDPRPAVAVEQARGGLAGRTVLITPTAQGAAFTVVGRESGDLARSLPTPTTSETRLAEPIGTLLDGSEGAAATASATLAKNAIGFVGVRAGAGDDVLRRIDAAEGLSRMADRGGFAFWRVAALGQGKDRPVGPARLTHVSGEQTRSVDTTGDHGATTATITARAGDTLQVAQPPGWARHASVTIDGQNLNAARGDGPVTYALPAGTHEVKVSVDPAQPWWRAVQGITLAAVVFLAIPFGNRTSRRRR